MLAEYGQCLRGFVVECVDFCVPVLCDRSAQVLVLVSVADDMLVVSEYTPHEGRAGFEEDERVFVVSDERVRLGSVVAVVDEQHFLEVILHVAVDGALVEALLDTELLTFDYGFTLLVERNVRLVPKADVEQEQREHQNQHKHYDILVGALRQPLADLRLLGNLRALVRVRFLLLLGALLLELERDGLRLLVELDEA